MTQEKEKTAFDLLWDELHAFEQAAVSMNDYCIAGGADYKLLHATGNLVKATSFTVGTPLEDHKTYNWAANRAGLALNAVQAAVCDQELAVSYPWAYNDAGVWRLLYAILALYIRTQWRLEEWIMGEIKNTFGHAGRTSPQLQGLQDG